MSLLDTIDGSFMNFAYGWAFSEPVRKVFYNLTITGLSVAVALIVGTAELLGAGRPASSGSRAGSGAPVAAVNINTLGYVIVGLFVVDVGDRAAGVALGRIEERWSAHLR